MRNLILLAHRWAGLVTGVVLVIVSLSGAAIAFESDIDRALNPALFAGEARDGGPGLDSLAVLARTVAGSESVRGIQLPATTGGAYLFTTDRGREIFINPQTGAINGTRTAQARRAGLASRLHEMHETILLGRGGLFLVRIVTALALLTIVGGVILWWPDKIWRVRKTGSWKRLNFDLHHVMGILATIPLLIITFTSMMMSWRPIDSAVVKAGGASPALSTVQPPPDPEHHALVSIDRAAAAAGATLPGATVTMVALQDTASPIIVALRFPEDHTPAGRSRVAIDRWRGTVISTVSTRDMKPGTKLSAMKRVWHTGDFGGTPTLILWVMASLVMAAQAVTGVIMWWNGRPARKAAAKRALAAA